MRELRALDEALKLVYAKDFCSFLVDIDMGILEISVQSSHARLMLICFEKVTANG